MEADDLRAAEWLAVHLAAALHADEAVSAVVLDGAFHAGIDRHFFGSEKLLTIDFAIDDPAVHETFLARVSHRDGFEVMVVLEVWVHVLVPVELVHNEVEVLMLALGHIFHEEAPRDDAAFDEVLVHAEDIAAPLRFVSTEAAG